MGLDDYIKKRDFSRTTEPKAIIRKNQGALQFVVQRHQARRLHYDLRLEMEGVLKSWAVPKGPSMNPQDKRLAIHTEDHPIDYLTFQGTIPKGNYGAGEMTIWDKGTYQGAEGYEGNLIDQLEKGDLKIEFFGVKLRGTFALVHTHREENDNQWLLIKKEDEYATRLSYDAEDLLDAETGPAKTSTIDIHQMVKPMLATKTRSIFSKPDWIYEIKWDGYRMLTNIYKGSVHMYSRNGVSYNSKFYSLVKQLQTIPYEVILDGEVVVLDENGIPEFQKLQNYNEDIDGELRYYIFDLLYLNGHDITHLPLLERKHLLEEVIVDIPQVYYCDHVASMGNNFYEQAIAAGLEGIIAKKADSLYIIGSRTENWLKIKSIESQEALICGYTISEGHLFGSLILGLYKEGRLTYIGNCGSGFNDALQKEMLQLFEPFIKEKSPFAQRINLKGRKVIWLQPVLICEINFTEWTTGGSMRHPVFKGMRSDKIPSEIQKEKEGPVPVKEPASISTETLEVNGFAVPISNLDKVYWPDEGITKYQLIDYYLGIAELILPFLKDRPENLHRHPEGIKKEGFYQKDTAGIFPHWIETVHVFSKSNEKEIEYLLCQHEATLLYMANLGCIEINPWNSRTGSLDHPDYSVIDIDPSDTNTFEEVIEVAMTAHMLLNRLEINGYCKTSGSSGIHIYLPLEAQYTYDEARDFTKLLCYFIHEELPNLTSMERMKDKRKGKIYLDFLQNRRGQTLAAPYCVRPKPGATVSAPLEWEELKPGLDMKDFNIFTMKDRIKKKPELFKGVLQKGIIIEETLEKLQ